VILILAFFLAGQNRGKAALEFIDPPSAHKAASHMDGGQLDGSILRVELSDLPIRARSRSPRPRRNGRLRSITRSLSRSRSPPPYRRRGGYDSRPRDSYRGRGYGRRGPLGRDTYRPNRSRTRSRSPVRRGPPDRLGLRRRSPSYERGGTGYGRGRRRSRSLSYSVRSSRSRTRSLTRSRSRSASYTSYSRYSRSRSRSRSFSRGRRSYSRDDIRDSRSRSPRD
jgi:RNA-binding protein with serine-rich domain 1